MNVSDPNYEILGDENIINVSDVKERIRRLKPWHVEDQEAGRDLGSFASERGAIGFIGERSHLVAVVYSDEIDEFALILRIGGRMQEFDFEGCERIRRSRKNRYITVDLGFPSRRWKSASDRDMRKYLAELVETGLLCCASRLEKDRAQVDIQRLMRDFSAAKKAFLRN